MPGRGARAGPGESSEEEELIPTYGSRGWLCGGAGGGIIFGNSRSSQSAACWNKRGCGAMVRLCLGA
jgi:hypothetical protein